MPNPAWTPLTAVTQFASVIIDLAGNVQQCSTTGVSGAVLPVFAAVLGAITNDGTAQWTCVAVLIDSSVPAELAGLPPPRFVNDPDGLDPQKVLDDMKASWQALAGRTLYPAQIEQLLINLYAYREVLVRNVVQYAGQQSLLAFANFPNIDYLALLVGVSRLKAAGASTTIKFTLKTPQSQPYTVAQGKIIVTTDGAIQFATQRPLTIPVGQTEGTVTARAPGSTGERGNGYPPGAVSVLLVDDGLATAANITTTADGALVESTDRLRARAQQAPNRFSVAGPTEAYRSFAQIDATIADVSVTSPAPGQVAVAVLGLVEKQPAAAGQQGVVTQVVLDEIANGIPNDPAHRGLSSEFTRPVCDTVTVSPAVEVDYTVDATVTLQDGANPDQVATALQAAGAAFALRLAQSLKNDIVPEEWIVILGAIGGVYRVQLSSPAYRQLNFNEWANCTGIALTLLNRAGELLGQVSA